MRGPAVTTRSDTDATQAPAAEQAATGTPGLAMQLALAVPAVLGAALSFQSLYNGAPAEFDRMRAAFPLAVDGVVLGASLRYVYNTRHRRPGGGWRALAWLGILLTLTLNALAAKTGGDVAWHVAGPLIWAAYVELAAIDARADRRRQREAGEYEPIPLGLWGSAPLDTLRLWLWMRRSGDLSHVTARVEHARHLAALQALRDAGLEWRRRRFVARMIRGDAVSAATVITTARAAGATQQAADWIVDTVLEAVSTAAETASASARRVHSTRRSSAPGSPATSALQGPEVQALSARPSALRALLSSASVPDGMHSAPAASAPEAAECSPLGGNAVEGRMEDEDEETGAGLPSGVSTGSELSDEQLLALISQWAASEPQWPSGRRTARRFRVGQDRARRLLGAAEALDRDERTA